MTAPGRLDWIKVNLISSEVVVVTFDICSSSDVIEELITKQLMDKYAQFMGRLKHHLAAAQRKVLFAPYKFTGDGWILIFPLKQYEGRPPAISPVLFVQFLQELSTFFRTTFSMEVMPYLDQPPSVTGINFGACMGKLHQTMMFDNVEFLGRPIIVACRLQGEIRNIDSSPAYKALIPEDVYQKYCSGIGDPIDVTVNLRNVRGGRDFRCKKISLPGSQ